MANTKPHMGMMADIVSMLTSKADCATASATADKVASLAGFSLRAGVRVAVNFANANTVAAAITLDVNSTGAKPVYNERGATSASNCAALPAGLPIEFVYDGVAWRYYSCDFGKTILDQVSYYTKTPASGSTTIPNDATIPQITEGDQYMSATITPKSATSRLVVEAVCNMGADGAYVSSALFRDSASDAVAAVGSTYSGNTAPVIQHTIKYSTISGNTNTTTFKVRIGASAGSIHFNGAYGNASALGGTQSSLIITEYAA